MRLIASFDEAHRVSGKHEPAPPFIRSQVSLHHAYHYHPTVVATPHERNCAAFVSLTGSTKEPPGSSIHANQPKLHVNE